MEHRGGDRLIGMTRYNAAIPSGHILAQPRYAYFDVVWFLTLFVLALLVAWLYAAARATLGLEPKTAFKALGGRDPGDARGRLALSRAGQARSLPGKLEHGGGHIVLLRVGSGEAIHLREDCLE